MTTGKDILSPKTADEALRLAHLMPPQEDASVLMVACRPDDFSASALAHAVEDSDAHLINLNVTDFKLDDGRIMIELRTNHRNGGSTARSLERYGFEVLDYDVPGGVADDDSEFTLRSRAAELLHIVNI